MELVSSCIEVSLPHNSRENVSSHVQPIKAVVGAMNMLSADLRFLRSQDMFLPAGLFGKGFVSLEDWVKVPNRLLDQRWAPSTGYHPTLYCKGPVPRTLFDSLNWAHPKYKL